MPRFNEKKKPVTPTETNFMGESAFRMKTKEELVSTAMTTTLSGNYYESQKTELSRLTALLDKVDPLFAAKLAIYVRNEGKLRTVTHYIAAYIARFLSGQQWGKNFYQKVCVRPDDMSEILACYMMLNKKNRTDEGKVNKLPNALKKGFKKKLESMDAYLIDKYKMANKEISLIDLVRLFTPHPTQVNQLAYERLIKGESLADLYDSRILEKQMSQAGQQAGTDEEKKEAKRQAIADVLSNPKGMPIFNLLRNLRNILVDAPDQVEEACKQLTNPQKIANSRLLPFRFVSAYEEIEKVSATPSAPKTAILFESDRKAKKATPNFASLKQLILSSIERAIELSCKNIPGLEGNCAILIDHSGSMRGDSGGSSAVSAFSKTSSAMIGNVLASMLAYKQDDVYIGLFGDRLINVPIDRSKGILEFNKKSFLEGRNCGPATENGLFIFLDACVKEKKKIDNLFIISDMQIGSGGKGGWDHSSSYHRSFQSVFQDFRRINPQCKTICVNIRQSGGTSVFDKSMQVLNVAGWSESIFDVISTQCKGWSAIIKEIEAIEL